MTDGRTDAGAWLYYKLTLGELKNRYFADRKNMKKFHDALKTIYGPKSSGATVLLSADVSTLLTDKRDYLGKVCI